MYNYSAQLWIYNILRNYIDATRFIELHKSKIDNIRYF